MRSTTFLLTISAIMLLLDFYVFQAVKVVSHSAGHRTRTIIFASYWVICISALILLLIVPYLNLQNYSHGLRTVLFAIIASVFFALFTASIFLLIDDIRRLVQWVAGKLFFRNTEGETIQIEDSISRSVFLSWVGLAAGAGILGSLVHGFSNKYNYHIKKVKLSFDNLPPAFKGLRIVQVSDIHSGSFNNKHAVHKGVEKVLALKPDIILFTGDLVNNESTEMHDYMEVFNQFKAPMGVYSILGNHDYGDYMQWPSPEAKTQNLERLKQIQAQMGWRLLLDEHVLLEKDGQQIALIGIQNWSAKARFPKYGNLKKAYAGSEPIPFKILMSHDPSHWDAQVRPQYPDIDLMLAGHTHGMQFGVETPWFKWSPVEYVYRQWAGLYQEQKQMLYVNRGYGFIGYPGRVGILPEITLLELI